MANITSVADVWSQSAMLAESAAELLQPILAPLAPLSPSPILKYAWTSMTDAYTPFQIATIGSFCVQLLFYFGMAFPGFLFQFFPFMNRFKVQQTKQHTLAEQWKCIRGVMGSKLGMYLPLITLSVVIFTSYGLMIPHDYESIPAWYNIAPRMLLCLMFEDTWHYWAHRTLHVEWLYGAIHKIHHTYNVPFGMAAEYAHPLETLILGLGFFIPIPFLCNHLFVLWLWLAIRMAQTTDAHSGYDLGFLNPFYYLPFYGGVRFHDFHHSNFNGNYASTFIYWDWICGTDKDFYKHEAKRKGIKSGKVAPNGKDISKTA